MKWAAPIDTVCVEELSQLALTLKVDFKRFIPRKTQILQRKNSGTKFQVFEKCIDRVLSEIYFWSWNYR